MRVLSTNAATAVGHPLGEDPVLVLNIKWRTSSFQSWFADRDFPTNVVNPSGQSFGSCQGRILQCGNLAAQKKQDVVGSMAAVSITLDDSDGAVKALFDANLVEGTPCILYQNFESANQFADSILLLSGVIVSPEWDEGARSLHFEIETRIHDLEVGFALEQNFYDNLIATQPLVEESAIGQAWPLCFGSVVHSPALKLLGTPKTTLNGDLSRQSFDAGQTFFLVEDSSKFPASCDVSIDGIIFTVSVDHSTNKMTIVDPNVPKYQNLVLDNRDATDPDANNPWVAWLTAASNRPIANNFIYYQDEHGNTVYNRVIRQVGPKFWMSSMRVQKRNGSNVFGQGFATLPEFLGPGTVIREVARFGRDGWGIQMSYVGATALSDGYAQPQSFQDTVQIIAKVTWKFESGAEVKLWSDQPGQGHHPITYVANSIPSSLVKTVFAWRTNPKTGQRLFKQIPMDYYTVNLDNAPIPPIAGADPPVPQHCTTVVLKTPLDELFGQGWEDTIYVSLRSSQGPNVADIIQYLITNYSTLTVDATSFAAVKALQANYPMGFCRSQKENVLQFVESLAWQARCALVMEDGTAKLRYLSKEPSVDLSIAEDKIEARSIVVDSTQFEDVTTSFRANWRLDYSGRPGKQRTNVKRENVSLFGLIRRDYDFYAYNVSSLVDKSASFWAHRMANVWKVAKLNVLARIALALEMFDTVQPALVDSTIFGGNYKGVVDAHSIDKQKEDETTFGLSLWLPVVSGTNVQDPRAWLSDSGDVLPPDPLNSISNTTIGEQWADPLSAAYSTSYVASHPAKIISPVNDQGPQFNGAFYVNTFDDGYSDQDGNDLPPTNVDQTGATVPYIAWPEDISLALDRTIGGRESPSMNLNPGDRVSIFNVTGMRWMFSVPADKAHVPAIVTTKASADGLTPGLMDFYAKGFGAGATKTDVPYFPVNPTSQPGVGDKIQAFKRDDVVYATSTGGGTFFWARIVASTGFGFYTFVQIDPNTNADVPSGITGSALERAIQSTVVPPAERVLINAVDGFYFFFYPLAACS